MTNQEIERRLREWYSGEIRSTESAPASLYDRLAAIPAMTAVDGARPEGRGMMLLLVAAALFVALAAGAALVGSGVVRLPQLKPAPLAVVASDAPTSPSVTPAPSATTSRGPSPWIIFGRSGHGSTFTDRFQSWAMRADGTGAHQIYAGGYVTGAWSRDGSRLLLNEGRIGVATVGADIGPFVDTGVVVPDNEQWEAFDFAPDGDRVVFVRKSKCATRGSAAGPDQPAVMLAAFTAETAGANCYVLSVLDLATRQLTDLDTTLVKDQAGGRDLALELPAWSPDGLRIAYTRLDEGTDARDLWVVNADGTSPASVSLSGDVSVQAPRWSPDSSRIAFFSERFPSEVGPSTSAVYVVDLATGRLVQITTGAAPDAAALCCAEWLDDDHLRVEGRGATDANRFWVAATDGTQAEAPLLVDLTDSLAAIGLQNVLTTSAPGDPGRAFWWQPVATNGP